MLVEDLLGGFSLLGSVNLIGAPGLLIDATPISNGGR